MKKILYLLLALFLINPAYAAVDIKWINAMPYEPYTKKINLEKIKTDFYEKNGIKIEKNVYKFEYVPKTGIPYEYILTNNTGNDLFLKGIDSDYFANKNITRKSHWTRMCARCLKHGKMYIPFYSIGYGIKCDKEKNPYWLDFPKNYTIKNGESLRVLAMGLKMEEIQNLIFIFTDNGKEFKIEF